MKAQLARPARFAAALVACAAAAAIPGVPALAAAAPPRVAAAAAALAEGRAPEAVALLSAVADEEGVSPDLYYDLGLAQLAAGEVGASVLSLERARWLAPGDRGIAAALGVAREKAGLAPAHAPGWMRVRSLLGPDGWASLLGVALALACAGAALHLVGPAALRRPGSLRRTLSAGTALATLILLSAAVAAAGLAFETTRGIAVGARVTLRLSPFEAAEARATLGAGESVEIEERHGDFIRVRTTDGRWGWAASSDIGAIVPG